MEFRLILIAFFKKYEKQICKQTAKMVSCAKCQVALAEEESFLECGKCRQRFHPVCVGLLPEAVPMIAEDLRQGKCWLCQTCVGRISLFSVYAHPEVNRMKLEIVAEVQSSVRELIASVQEKVDTTAHELSLLKQKHEGSVRELTKRIQELEITQATQSQETSYKFDDIHRQLRRDEAVVLRVPFKENEDPRKLFISILDALQLPREQFVNATIRRISRVNPQSSSRKVVSPPIVITFESKFKRSEFMLAYFRKKNLSIRDLGFPSDDRVYINENLSAQNHAAFQIAMGWKREKKVHSVKVSDGMVFVNTSKDSKSIRVFHHTRLLDEQNIAEHRQKAAEQS